MRNAGGTGGDDGGASRSQGREKRGAGLDLTKLPIGEMLIVFLLLILAGTFGAAFISLDDGQDSASGGPASLSTPQPTPTAQASPPAGSVIQIAMVPAIKFDRDELILPANQEIAVEADNRDGGIPHNWAAYVDESAAELVAKTEICNAPCLREVSFTTPAPGEYFFRCDVHPTTMVGKLTVK